MQVASAVTEGHSKQQVVEQLGTVQGAVPRDARPIWLLWVPGKHCDKDVPFYCRWDQADEQADVNGTSRRE